MHIGQIIREAWRDFTSRFADFLTYYIAYSLILVVLLTPLVIWLLNLFVSSTGRVAISDYDLARFVLSPVGLVTVIVVGGIVFGLALARDTGTMLIGFGNISNRRVTFRQAFAHMLWRLPSVFLLTMQIVLLVVIVAIPFLIVIGLILNNLLSQASINYYLAARPPEWTRTITLIGLVALPLIALLAYGYVRFSFILPTMLFQDQRGRASLVASWRLVSGNAWPVALLRLGWFLLAYTAAFAIQALFWRAAQLIFDAAVTNIIAIVIVTAGILVLNLILLAVVNFLRTMLTALFALHLYRAVAGQRSVAPALPEGFDSAEKQAHWRIPRIVWPVAAAGAVVAVIFVALGVSQSLALDTDVEITAHRGSSADAPENSLAAAQLALAQNADVIEIDVQETKDGTIVVLHDKDIERVTGVPQFIWEVTYDEVKDLDAGSWFAPAFADERIPTLDQLLDVVGDDAIVNIELKYNGHDEQLAKRVVDIIEARGVEDQVVLMSLEYSGMQEVRQLNPDLRIGLLATVAVGDLTELDVDFLALAGGAVDRAFLTTAHDKGMDIAVWTINDPEDMVQFINLGVDSIITDKPQLLNQVIEELGSLSAGERIMIQLSQLLGFNLPIAQHTQ